MDIPKRTILNRKIPKKAFFSEADFSSAEKELFTSQVDGIYLLSVMNQQSMKIQAYQTKELHYAEVVWVYVKIRSKDKNNRIAQVVHKAIPNPVVLVMESPEGDILLSACHKRLHKMDVAKVVLEEPVITNWFQPRNEEDLYTQLLDVLMMTKLSFDHLYHFYDDIYQWLRCEEVVLLVNDFPKNTENRDDVVEALDDIRQNQNEITRLENEQKGQLDFGIKMDLHMKIKRQEQQVEQKLQKIKELC